MATISRELNRDLIIKDGFLKHREPGLVTRVSETVLYCAAILQHIRKSTIKACKGDRWVYYNYS